MRIKLGIIGSSYSRGNHKITVKKQKKIHGDFSPKFEEILKKYLDKDLDVEIYNCAMPGKGSEQFLSSIVYLKKIYDVDIILMEIVNDREYKQLRLTRDNYSYKDIYDDISVNDFFQLLKVDRFQSYIQPTSSITSPANLSDETTWNLPYYLNLKEIKSFLNIRNKLLIDSEDFFSTINILFSIDLCKLLDIKVVAWSSNINLENISMFNSVKNDLYFIDFPKNKPGITYYKDLYKANAVCDHGGHLSIECENMLINDFIVPQLHNAIKDLQ